LACARAPDRRRSQCWRLGKAGVEEAATDVIALRQALGEPEPWLRPEFVDQVATLQRQREMNGPPGDARAFSDRSPVCTLALARFLGRPVPPLLSAELDRITGDAVYAQTVFLVRSQGFVTATAARRITLSESLEFERMHEEACRACGFELVDVPAAPLAHRAALVGQVVAQTRRVT
jgi:predicted ATPase